MSQKSYAVEPTKFEVGEIEQEQSVEYIDKKIVQKVAKRNIIENEFYKPLERLREQIVETPVIKRIEYPITKVITYPKEKIIEKVVVIKREIIKEVELIEEEI